MNTILGGMFQSRLNANIREEKGYSYGVSSSFGYGKGPGPFRTGGDIVTEKSDAALVEFMKELKGIVGSRPITDEELSVAKDALIQRLPATFASVSSINNALTTLWTQQLPDDYYQQYAKKIAAITRDDVLRVAKQYVTVDHLAIVIVGDKSVIEGPLKAAEHRADRVLRHRGESGRDEVASYRSAGVFRPRHEPRTGTREPRDSRTSASPPAEPAAGRRRRCAGTRRS